MSRDRDRDEELQSWAAEWQGGTGLAPEERTAIGRRVRRRSRWMAVLTAVEVAIVAAALGGLLPLLLAAAHGADLAALTAFCAMALAILAFSLWNRRGVWRPRGESVGEFVALSRERNRREARALRAGWLLLAAETAVFVPWIAWRFDPAARPEAYGLQALLAGAAAAILLALARRARRERHELDRLHVQLEEP
jgi:hypothetical protein